MSLRRATASGWNFPTAQSYRIEAGKWEHLAFTAQRDGDAFWYEDAKREAAALRQKARELEAADFDPTFGSGCLG